MPRALRAIAGLITGCVIGAAVGAGLVSLLSANTHDKSLEIAMTAFFAAGPIGAVVGLFAGLLWKR